MTDAATASRPEPARGESVTARLVRRFFRNRAATVAVVILSIIVLMAVFAPQVSGYGYETMDLRGRSQPPSAEHWMGTDRVGRDILSRTVYGARISLIVGFASTAIAALIGIVLGAASGWFGGWVETLVMRFTDVVMTFPPIIIMLTLASFLPRGLWPIVLIIGGLSWPGFARLIRGQILALKEQDFISAAQALGALDARIVLRHLLPNAIAPLMAMISFSVGNAILTEAGLSFLGLGVPPPAPSWGNMLEAARNLDVLRNLPWAWLPPAFMTVLTVLCVNFIGDGLRDSVDARSVL